MNTDKIEFIPSEHVIMCPNCKVCSESLSEDEFKAVNAGQQMLIVCSVCGTIMDGETVGRYQG